MTGWGRPQVAELPGARLHLQHGPIDLVVKAEGPSADAQAAYAAAAGRFRSILDELVGELPLLRGPLAGDHPPALASSVARRMVAACWPHRHVFITPMAAVAGAVADEVRDAMLAAAPGLSTLYVNNGGDIAIHIAKGAELRIGVIPDLVKAMPDGVVTLPGGSGIGGVATSGWRGRSFSLGIADAATVLASSAAEADAAATIVANAVNADDPAITRAPARSLDPDSDLRDLPVTTDVGALSVQAITAALDAGERTARRLVEGGLIAGAMLSLRGAVRIVTSGDIIPAPR
ncbi:MAG: UPF0280 family protein [Beijerinckiaceae bacterium]